jgi:predicted GIY-YIG superfamily endonuclease
MKTWAVYRFFDAKERVLYIGSTGNFPLRLAQHKSLSLWFAQVVRHECQHYLDREVAMAVEALAVLNEQPIFNKFFKRETSTTRAWAWWIDRWKEIGPLEQIAFPPPNFKPVLMKIPAEMPEAEVLPPATSASP